MLKLTKNIKVISFDIFDTLIKRKVGLPRDIFWLVKKKCEELSVSCPENYVQLRMSADVTAQEKYNGSATIEAIYYELSRLDKDYEWEKIQEIEINTEIHSCVGNSVIIEKFLEYKKQNIPIIIVSDMYLSSQILGKMLSNCGIDGYKKIYVSCEWKATKGRGDLFSAVLKDQHLLSNELLHIGDNWKGDYLIPKSKGINVEHVSNKRDSFSKYIDKRIYNKSLTYRSISSTAEIISGNMTFAEKCGCYNFGPVLFGFVNWLSNEAQKDGVGKIIFLARDGYIIKKAFDMLGNNEFEVQYLYCSRRAFTVPLIWKCESLNDLRTIIPFPHRLSLRDFAERIGLTNYSFTENVFLNVDIAKEYEHFSLFEQDFFQPCFSVLLDEAKRNSKEEFKAIKQYLTDMNLSGHIAVVDIGYHGTMQYALEKILKEIGIQVTVTGYYVVVASDEMTISSSSVTMKGYLQDSSKNLGIYDQILNYVPLFELAFMAPHGSTEKFVLISDVVKPVLYPFEYSSSPDEYRKIEEIQSGALKLCEVFYQSDWGLRINIEPTEAISNYTRMGLKPSLAEAVFWGDMTFFEYGFHEIAKPQKIVKYLAHPSDLKSDMLHSFWKIGFLKRMGKLNFPYDRIVDIAKRRL